MNNIETHKVLKKARQKMYKSRREWASAGKEVRREHTKKMIDWARLVVNAKMSEESKAVILGALVDAKEQMKQDPEMRKIFRLKGEAAFMGFND